MASINTESNAVRKVGVQRMKKHRLKTEMTPMVDLGFLLITFFVFTTEITKPVAMNLYMPHDGDATKSGETKSMTILRGNNNKLFYYFGTEEKARQDDLIFPISYDEKNGVGKMIREKQSSLEQRGFNKNELTVLIKSGKQSSYKNTVDILDEMIINNVTRYALVKPSDWEENYLNQ